MWFNTITKKKVRLGSNKKPFYETEQQQMTLYLTLPGLHSKAYLNSSFNPPCYKIQHSSFFLSNLNTSWRGLPASLSSDLSRCARGFYTAGATSFTQHSLSPLPGRARGYLPESSALWALLQPGSDRRGALRNHPLGDLSRLTSLGLPYIHI